MTGKGLISKTKYNRQTFKGGAHFTILLNNFNAIDFSGKIT